MQAYHRDILEHMSPPATYIHYPAALTNEQSKKASLEVIRDRKSGSTKMTGKRGRERKSGSRRHRMRAVIGRDTNSF